MRPTIVFFQFFALFITGIVFFVPLAQAHPGRTDSSGCHTCKTNCTEKWGLSYGEYHCHNAPKSTPSPTKKPVILQPTSTPKVKTVSPTKQINNTSKPISTPIPLKCSAVVDSACPSGCTAGNDVDCCNKTPGYSWYNNWGCYPEEVGKCSAIPDYKCSSRCTAGNDHDCCLSLEGHTWYENRGCYPKQ